VEEWNGDKSVKPVDPWSPDLQNGLSQLQPSESIDPWGGSGPWKTQIGNDTLGTNSYSTHNRSSSPVRDSTSHISFGQRSTPLPRPLSEGWESVEKKDNSPAPLAGSMTKEEKAAEMARRKEERKQVRGSLFHYSCLMKKKHVTAYCSTEGEKEECKHQELIFVGLERWHWVYSCVLLCLLL